MNLAENYTQEELKGLLHSVGENVRIHRSVMLFNPKTISVDSNVRIDCFSILSSGIEGIHIGSYVHIGASTHLFGSGGKILIEDFANISSRVSLFTASDDYKEGFLTNPMLPESYKKVETGPISIGRHSIIGCGSIVLPNVQMHLGASIGALSLVKGTVGPFEIVAGIPARLIGERSQDLIIREKDFLAQLS